jgi:DNA-binding protein HU-beta
MGARFREKRFVFLSRLGKHFPTQHTLKELSMNRKELIERILGDKTLSHITKKDADQFVNVLLDVVKNTVKKGDEVSLIGFGTFTKVKRAARAGVNPATGEKIKIKARTLPKFRPGKAWKEML